jgi:hypothetical protein
MKFETLETANLINKKIKELDVVISCLQQVDQEIETIIDYNPSLIIECDDWDGGREQIRVPMVLSDQLIILIQKEVVSEKNRLLEEFNNL